MTTITFKTAESFSKPPRTEKATHGYYIRRNYSTEIVKDPFDETIENTKYIYEEAFLTPEEYQTYIIGLAVSKEDTSDAYLRYKKALDTSIVYREEDGGNGLLYKPKWVKEADGTNGIYLGLIDNWERLGGSQAIEKLALWDATERAENVREFTMDEFKALIKFLALEQEKIFNLYKLEKSEEN